MTFVRLHSIVYRLIIHKIVSYSTLFGTTLAVHDMPHWYLCMWVIIKARHWDFGLGQTRKKELRNLSYMCFTRRVFKMPTLFFCSKLMDFRRIVQLWSSRKNCTVFALLTNKVIADVVHGRERKSMTCWKYDMEQRQF